MPPSSPKVSAPSSAQAPPMSQTSSATPGSPPDALSTGPGTTQIPDPMTVPTTTRTRSRRVRVRGSSRGTSVSGRHAVLAWIRSGPVALRETQDRLRAAEGDSRVRRDDVPERGQAAPDVVADCRLQGDPQSVEVTESWRVDRVLQIHPEHQQVEQHLEMSLGLHRAAHHAEGEPRLLHAGRVGPR